MTQRSSAVLLVLFWLLSAFAGDRRTVGVPAVRALGEHTAIVARTAQAYERLPVRLTQLSDRRASGPAPLLFSYADAGDTPATYRVAAVAGRVPRAPAPDARTFPYDATAPPAGSQ